MPPNPQKRQKILGFRPSAAVVADPPPYRARTYRRCAPQGPYDYGLHSSMLRGGCAHGRRSSRPGCGAKWAPQSTLRAFDGGAHGAIAPLSAPTRVNPGHTERCIPSHTQPHAAGGTLSPFLAARAIFVPEFESAGPPFCASGPGGTASNPNTPPPHMYHWIGMAVLYLRCTGFAHGPAITREICSQAC